MSGERRSLVGGKAPRTVALGTRSEWQRGRESNRALGARQGRLFLGERARQAASWRAAARPTTNVRVNRPGDLVARDRAAGVHLLFVVRGGGTKGGIRAPAGARHVELLVEGGPVAARVLGKLVVAEANNHRALRGRAARVPARTRPRQKSGTVRSQRTSATPRGNQPRANGGPRVVQSDTKRRHRLV